MTEKIVLHGMTSPNVIKVVLMLEECELDYELRHVAVFSQEQFKPEFLRLNPLGKVPVLEDPRLRMPLAESGAILLWLGEREGKFLPTEQPARAEVMQWLMFQMANYGPMLGQLNHFCSVLESGSEPYAEGRYRALARRLYGVLDEHLSTRTWLAGDAYSIADIAMRPWADYLERHQFDPANYPALVEWRNRIAARPAWQRAQERVNSEFLEKVMRSRAQATREDLDRFFNRTNEVPEPDYPLLREREKK